MKEWILGAILLILIVFNGILYIGNLTKFHTIFPSIVKVLGPENAVQNAAYKRNSELLKNRDKNHNMNIFTFIPKWTMLMQKRVFAITGHKSMNIEEIYIYIYDIIIISGLVLLFKNSRTLFANGEFVILSVIAVLYFLTILVQNYMTQLRYNQFSIAMQGRYLFPILFPIWIIISNGLLSRFKFSEKILITAIVAIIFLSGGFLFFITNPASLTWLN